MATSTATKGHLDKITNGLAAAIVATINNQNTNSVSREHRDKMAIELGGVGESNAFFTAASSGGTLSVAIMNRLEKTLHGRGNAEELKTLIAAGSGA